MAYFNLRKQGKPISTIIGGDNNGEVVYLQSANDVCCNKCSSECSSQNKCCGECKGCGFNVIQDNDEFADIFGGEFRKLENGQLPYIQLDNGSMSPIPRIKKKGDDAREIIFISGPEESGKSTWAASYIKRFKTMYPKSIVYVFSGIEKDKVIDDLKPIRIKLNENLHNDPISINEFPENSLVLFDDIDTLKNKKVKEAVLELRDRLLEEGRHKSIFVISITHNPTMGKQTKHSLLESSSIVLFPMGGDAFHMKRVLKEYCGYNPKNIDTILNLKSRWIQCHKRYPKFILHEKGAFFP